MFEIWKPLPGNGIYAVSNFGRVKVRKDNRIVKPFFEDYYLKVTIMNKCSKEEISEKLKTTYNLKSYYVHDLVAKAFLESDRKSNSKKTVIFKNNKHHMPWASNLKLV